MTLLGLVAKIESSNLELNKRTGYAESIWPFTFYLKVCRQMNGCVDGYQRLKLKADKKQQANQEP